MASSGNAYTNYVGNLRLRFSWQISGTSINWSLVAEKGDSNYRTMYNYEVIANGRTIGYSDDEQSIYDGTVIDSGSLELTDSLNVSISAGIGQYSVNAEGSGSWSVDAYAHLTKLEVKSKTVNSITLSYTTDRAAWLFVKLNDGEWLNNGDPFASNTTSGEFTIYYKNRANTQRLDPNTSYKITVLCRAINRDSGIDTSQDIRTSTYQIATISSANNFNHGDNDSITIANPSGAGMSLTMKIGNTTILTKTPTTGVNTITFTQEQLDNIYKLYGTANSLTVTYIVSITVNSTTYTNSRTCTITLTGNQKTAKTNVNGTWKRGAMWTNVNGTWRRAVMWTNVNGTWKRCI